MVDANIEDFINKKIKEGWKYSDINLSLLNAGWKKDTISMPLSKSFNVPTPNSVSGLGSTSMWDSFEHILLFISLYALTFSVISILYTFIDKWVPGITINRYIYGEESYSISFLRGNLAALVVSYPIFSYFFLSVTNRTIKNPLIKGLTTRKLLTYFTLIVAFSIVLGYIIGIIYNFLSGDVTFNFALKFLATVITTGIIFVYYLNQVKEDRRV